VPHPNAAEVKQAIHRIRRQSQIPNGELRLLSYVVEESLVGRAGAVSQKVLAADVFGRDLLVFDPRSDSTVRTTAANLRQSLVGYYSGPGRSDPVVIELPKGSYLPRFTYRLALSDNGTSLLWGARVALESRTISGYRTAHQYLDDVLTESPRLSLAMALKAEAFASQAIHGSRPRPNLLEAESYARMALQCDRPAWLAYLVQASVQWALHLNWVAARAGYDRALDLSAGESSSHVWYTAFLVGMGQPRHAIRNLQAAVDSFGYANAGCLADLAMLAMLARDLDLARSTITTALQVAPADYKHHLNRAILLEAEGNPAAALTALDETPLKILERPVTWGLRALFAGLSGSHRVAQRRLQWLSGLEKLSVYVPPSQIAACYLGTGEYDAAIRSLELARDERDPLMVWFFAYPFFRHLHGNVRFERLIDSIGLVRF